MTENLINDLIKRDIQEKITKLNNGEIKCNNKFFSFPVWNGCGYDIVNLKNNGSEWLLI